VPEDALHCFGLRLRLVDEPVAERMAEVMKAKPLAFFDGYPDTDGRRSQMVGHKDRGGEWNLAVWPEWRPLLAA